MITNSSAYTLRDVSLGDVYVIEIVPSSTFNNGSATVTTISKFSIRHIKHCSVLA